MPFQGFIKDFKMGGKAVNFAPLKHESLGGGGGGGGGGLGACSPPPCRVIFTFSKIAIFESNLCS